MSAATTHVQGFRALPVKFKESSKAHHWLYCKEHSVREKNIGKPAGCTLFIVNVPSYYTEECLKKLFGDCGPIQAVHFHQKPTSTLPPVETSQFFPKHTTIKGFKVAYIVFESADGLKEALNLNWDKPAVVWDAKSNLPSAVERWKQQHDAQIPNLVELQADIDCFMQSHDNKVATEEQKMKEEEGKPDDEGWITVTKRGRKPGFARKESVEQRVMAKEGKKKAKKELLNFYTFQIRETKMKHLAELRHKFEDDKKRIVQLRQSRRFKPF